jgi:hypothetical protein
VQLAVDFLDGKISLGSFLLSGGRGVPRARYFVPLDFDASPVYPHDQGTIGSDSLYTSVQRKANRDCPGVILNAEFVSLERLISSGSWILAIIFVPRARSVGVGDSVWSHERSIRGRDRSLQCFSKCWLWNGLDELEKISSPNCSPMSSSVPRM